MPLDDGELQKIGVFEHHVAVLRLHGDDFPLRDEGVRQDGHRKHLSARDIELEVVRRDGADAHGALDGVGEIALPLFKERLAVFGDEHAALKDRLHVEFGQVIDEHEIGVVRRRDRPLAPHMIAFGDIEGRHADGFCRRHAACDKAAQRVVHMPLVGKVVGVLIVRTGEETAEIEGRDRRAVDFQVVRRGAVAKLHIHAAGDLFRAFFGGAALMVGRDARRKIGVERVAADVGRMTVDDLSRLVRRFDLFKGVLIGRKHPGIVHHLPQPVEERAFDLMRGLRAVQNGAARFEGRSRHARGKLQKDVERFDALLADAGERLFDVLRARDAADVDELVRIGDDARRAVRDGEPRKGFGGEQGTLHMDMGVHQPGEDDKPAAVVDFLPLVPLAEGGDRAPFDGDLRLFYISREYIEDARALDDKVALFALHGAVDELFHSPHYSTKAALFQAAFHDIGNKNPNLLREKPHNEAAKMAYERATSSSIMRQKPRTMPEVAKALLPEKHSGMSSEQTTAIIAPAEKESAHGMSPATAPAARTPARQAGTSTAPDPTAKRKLLKGVIPFARSGKATHIPSGRFCTAMPNASRSAPAPAAPSAKATPTASPSGMLCKSTAKYKSVHFAPRSPFASLFSPAEKNRPRVRVRMRSESRMNAPPSAKPSVTVA